MGSWFGTCLLVATVTLGVASGCAVAPLEAEALPVADDPQLTEARPAPPPPSADCEDECHVGVAQCESTDGARVCERGADGCTRWSSKTCAPGAACIGAPDNCLADTPVCTDECEVEGKKKCDGESSAGVLACTRGDNGCLAWAPAASCTGSSSCDLAKNDGSCKAGCTNDVGCDASKEGAARCSSTGLSSQRCQKDGACYRWKIEQSVPQQCTGSGAYTCSGTSAKKVCTTRTVGACTAHEAKVEACASGTACSGAGVCKATCPAADGCSVTMLYKTRCKAGTTTGRQVCVKDAAGCYAWSDTTTCSGGNTCSGGTCSCAGCMFGAVCVSGTQKAACGKGGATCRDCNSYCAGLGRVAQACTSTGACSCSTAF